MQCYLMMLVVIGGIGFPLHAAPPEISEAELDAFRAQYGERMIRLNEVDRLRDENMQAQRQNKRLHREQQLQSAIRDIVEQDEAEYLPVQAELDDLKLDFSAVDISDISLGMWSSQDKPAGGAGAPAASKASLAEQATNPAAPLIQLQFQNTFNGKTIGADGVGNTFVVQPVIPFKLAGQQFLSRITLPLLIATADLGDPIGREYGMGDLTAITFATFAVDKGGPWQGTFGAGPAITIPTATSDFLGNGKWQAGPNLLYINTATKGFQWGALVYQQWSFASTGGDDDRPDVSKFYFQPILTYHFDKNWYVKSSSVLMSIDWEDNSRWSIPIGVQLGTITKIFGNQPAKMFVETFYDVSGNNTGTEWGIKIGLTLLFPSS